MRILVIGKGFLGSEFAANGYTTLDRADFDVSQSLVNWKSASSEQELRAVLAPWDVVVNCIGKASARWCNQRGNWNGVHVINALWPRCLSYICESMGKRLVHISTGCLYDTNVFPQSEASSVAAHCPYTLSKWAGEQWMNLDSDIVIRPRLLFNHQQVHGNLLWRMRQFPSFLEEPNTFTATIDIVRATEALLDAGVSGIFNVGCTGKYSIREVGYMIGKTNPAISVEDLRAKEGWHMVNALMDMSKISEFCEMPDLQTRVSEMNCLLVGAE